MPPLVADENLVLGGHQIMHHRRHAQLERRSTPFFAQRRGWRRAVASLLSWLLVATTAACGRAPAPAGLGDRLAPALAPFDAAASGLEGASVFDAASDWETDDEDTLARPDPDFPELAAALNAFALEVYAVAHASDASWVFAPASLEDVVTLMAFGGGGGPTSTEFWKPLRIDPSKRRGEVREGMFVKLGLRHAGRSERTTLLEAARLWTRHGVADVASPMKEGVFRARAAELSPNATTEMSRAEINAWTAEQTGDHVVAIVPPAALDPAMMAVATGAAYFGCELASSESEDGVVVQVRDGAATSESIAVRGTFGYARLEGVELVDIPVGRGLSLTMVVPEDIRTLHSVEARLASGLDRWTSALAPMPAVVRLPRWSTRSSGDLRGALRSLGVSRAFGEQARFGVLTTKPGVHIDRVVYETLVEVSPASRDARSASPTGELADTPREIRIEGPFVYFVRDRATRLILVMGRYVGRG